MSRLFGHRPGRHRRHGSLTGWAALASLFPEPGDDFTRRRSTPLALCPVSDDVIPFADYRHPYDPPKGSAA